MDQLPLSFNQAANIVAQQAAASRSYVRDAVTQFRQVGQLPSPFTAHLGKGNPDHELHGAAREPTDEEKALIEELVESTRHKGHYHSLTTLKASLSEEL